MTPDAEAGTAVEGHNGIVVLRGSGLTRGWNGIRYKTGLSARNTRAKQLSMNVATIPPGGVAFAHIHVEFEVMLYILEGAVRHEYGPALEHTEVAGDAPGGRPPGAVRLRRGCPRAGFPSSSASTMSYRAPVAGAERPPPHSGASTHDS